MSGDVGRLVALAWARSQPRTEALARELGGECHLIHRPGPLPVRYLASAVQTWRLLDRVRPGRVLAVAPPVWVPLLGALWCRLFGGQLVVDCHPPDCFDSLRWAWARPLLRRLLRRARATLVHTPPNWELVRGWGAPAVLLVDDVPDPLSQAPGGGADVVIAGSFDANEPVATALEAARRLPHASFAFTGDPARLSRRLRAAAPPNVAFTGYLPHPEFLATLAAAEVVAVFSGHPAIHTPRAAFEAAGLGRPLVLLDLPGARATFAGAAVFAPDEPAAMAGALEQALAERPALARSSRERAADLRERHRRGLDELLEMLSGGLRPAPPCPPPGEGEGRVGGEDHAASPRGRVLVLSLHSYPEVTVLRRNVHHLLEQGFRVDLVCQTEPAFDRCRLSAGLRLFRIPIAHRRRSALRYPLEYVAFTAAALAVACRLALADRHRAVQVDNMPDLLVLAALPARLRGARVVLNMLELGPELTAARLSASARHPAVRAVAWVERLATTVADHVITVSDPCRRRLEERGVSRVRITVVPNSAPPPAATARPPSPIPGAASPPPPPPYLITTATLIRRYGVAVAIRAFAAVVAERPDLGLRVLGEGEMRPELERLAAQLGVADRVGFLGWLPWEETMAQASQARLGLVPIIADGYGEILFPTKLLEYVELGLPVVAARLPAIREYFPDSTVAYFEPGDHRGLATQLRRLLADEAAAAAQAARARQAARSLRWSAVSPRYLAALGLEP